MLVQAHGNHPLFITRYPDPMCDFGREIEVEKFFNMLPDKENPGRVLSSDLILPVAGESVGSAARVDDVETLIHRLENSKMFARLQKRGGSLDDFSWYINRSRENGMVPHAGCGFGMARILQWVNGVSDIRDAVTFPQNQETLI
jgi:asparaginyl-tRNA synthetase